MSAVTPNNGTPEGRVLGIENDINNLQECRDMFNQEMQAATQAITGMKIDLRQLVTRFDNEMDEVRQDITGIKEDLLRRIAQLESIGLERPQVNKNTVVSEFDCEDPPAWTTGPAVADEERTAQFECVFLPFTGALLRYWTTESQHNAATGPMDRWTQVDEKAKWFDPLVPQTADNIKFLKKNHLIKRVVLNFSDETNAIQEFINCFQYVLPSVTNVKNDESLTEAVVRLYEENGMEPDGFPKWVFGFKRAMIPLKPAFANDRVLEYLSQPTIRKSPFSKLSFFTQPGMHQQVRDPKTGQKVYRVYFTTIEGYLGHMEHTLGLSNMNTA